MLVEAHVSSTNTSRAGSRSSWPSNQSSRRFRTSGRSCSAACADFFDRQAAAVEEGPDRAHARSHAALGKALLDLDDREVRGGFDQTEQEVAMRIKLRAPRLSLSARGALAAVDSPADPYDCRRDANPEPHRRLPGWQSRQGRVDHPVSQILAVGPCHARPPSESERATRT
jgi:hypothetical protein